MKIYDLLEYLDLFHTDAEVFLVREPARPTRLCRADLMVIEPDVDDMADRCLSFGD